MSQISKCPKVADVLSYWEASEEVSEPCCKSLLYFSSNGSYCTTDCKGQPCNFRQIRLLYLEVLGNIDYSVAIFSNPQNEHIWCI